MGEPTCVIHAFSYTSGISDEPREENTINDLEQSVSFGRFTSEPLSWEKWSAFNRNRYVEEAEMYSKPGSVKQKKAYLEAHFKRVSAVKAAASPEQASAVQEAPSETSVAVETHDDNATRALFNDLHSQQSFLSPQPGMNDQWVKEEVKILGSGHDQNEDNPNYGEVQLSSIRTVGSDQAGKIQPREDLMEVEKQNPFTEMEGGFIKTENCLQISNISQEISAPALQMTKRNPPLSSYITSVEAGKSAAQPPEVHSLKEKTSSPICRKSWMDDPDKKKTPLCTSITRELSRLISPFIKKIGSSSKASKKHYSARPKTPPKEESKGHTKLCLCFGAKLSSNSYREKERHKIPTEKINEATINTFPTKKEPDC